MQAIVQRNALLTFALAFVFWWAFFFMKHSPKLRAIVPFGEDPYDAVGSFGFLLAAILAFISLARSFLPQAFGKGVAIGYISRTQVAVTLCVLATVSSDAIAMARHMSMWNGGSGRGLLLALLCCLLGAAVGVLLLIRSCSPAGDARGWARATSVCAGSSLVLWLYPERWIRGVAGHMLTIVLSAFLLVAPVAALVVALVPQASLPLPSSSLRRGRFGAGLRWVLATLLGLGIGLAAFAAELREEFGQVSLRKLLLVGAVYAASGLSGLLVGSALLGRPLGFISSE